MKNITFNSKGPRGNSKLRLNILHLSSDFDGFRTTHIKAQRDIAVPWHSYEYTIKDDLANFLKMKYPDIVNIEEWTKW